MTHPLCRLIFGTAHMQKQLFIFEASDEPFGLKFGKNVPYASPETHAKFQNYISEFRWTELIELKFGMYVLFTKQQMHHHACAIFHRF